MIGYLIGAHLIGDFLLQNHWMQRKSQSSWVCAVHVAFYSLPFWLLVYVGMVPWPTLLLILLQHWLQDRFQLHVKWMKEWGHTTPDKWPVGPLCIDQSMHVGFMWLLSLGFMVNP